VVNQLNTQMSLKLKYYYCILVEPLGWVKTLKRVRSKLQFQ
jgi:hypothetical protein